MKSIHVLVIISVLALSACATTERSQVEPFTVDLRSPQLPIGEIEWQVNRFMGMGGLRKNTVVVSYFPREDAVSIQYRAEFITYHQFWSRDGRQAFIKALAQYNEDFEARNLQENNARRTRRAYGVVKGYLIWQLHAITVRARGNMNVELGYEFRGRTPYFTINQREALYVDPLTVDSNRTSPVMTMYFTRAQAEVLAGLFDQEFLQGLVETDTSFRVGSSDIDVY